MPWLPLLTPTSAFIPVLIWISLHHKISPFLTTFFMGQRPPLLDRPVTIGDDERPVSQRAREGCSCDDVVAYHSCRVGAHTLHDILSLLLSSPFIPCPLLVSCHSPVIVPFRLTQRRSANCGSSNRGDGSRNTCFRTSTSSVPVLSYCTCPGLRCLTSSLHCYTPTRLLLGVTHPISHRLPKPGNNFFRS